MTYCPARAGSATTEPVMPDSAIVGHSASSPPSIATTGAAPLCLRMLTTAATAFGAPIVVAVTLRSCAASSPGVHRASPSLTSAVVPVWSSFASSRTCRTSIIVGRSFAAAPSSPLPAPGARRRSSTSRRLSRPSAPRRSVTVTPSITTAPSSTWPSSELQPSNATSTRSICTSGVSPSSSPRTAMSCRTAWPNQTSTLPTWTSRPSLTPSLSTALLRTIDAPSRG